MSQSRGFGDARSEINITPYIDILLVLLIIFMVLQPVEEYELRGRVPQEAGPRLRAPADFVVLTIDAEYLLDINGESVELSRLGSRLFEVYSGRRNKSLFIRASRDLAFGSVARIIDIAKGSGVQDVGLMKL